MKTEFVEWQVPKFDPVEKTLIVPGELTLEVDFDDVDHEEVYALIKEVVRTLNTYWVHGGSAIRMAMVREQLAEKRANEPDD